MSQQQSQSTTHWRQIHRRKNTNLLFAEDLGPIGTKLDIEVIDSGVVSVSGADNKSKSMPWLAFAGKDGRPKQKRLALNVTNCKAMQSITSSPVVEKWRGWITLVVVSTTYTDTQTGTRQTTDAIRIAPTRPPAPRSSSPPRDERSQQPSRQPPSSAPEPDAGQGAAPDDTFALTTPTDDELRDLAERERQESARG